MSKRRRAFRAAVVALALLIAIAMTAQPFVGSRYRGWAWGHQATLSFVVLITDEPEIALCFYSGGEYPRVALVCGRHPRLQLDADGRRGGTRIFP